jgi:hypothetical protein
VVIIGAVIIVKEKVLLAVTPRPSMTLIMAEAGPPAARGVPLMVPVELRVRPEGKLPDRIDQV